jgi:hypothetical protein
MERDAERCEKNNSHDHPVTNPQQGLVRLATHRTIRKHGFMSDVSRAPRLVFSRSGSVRQQADQRAVSAMQALGQASRLAIFRLLLRYEPKGLAVGTIAERLKFPQNTVSAHLSILGRALSHNEGQYPRDTDRSMHSPDRTPRRY